MKKTALIVSGVSEFAPIVTFVVASEMLGFMRAIIFLAVAAFISVVLEWRFSKRIPKFGLFASLIIALFAALSLITNDPFFIIIKDTIYAGGFALLLLLGLWRRRFFLKFLFGDFFAMTERGWQSLTRRWIVWFCILAITNEIARAFLAPEIWVYYKFAAVFLTWVFAFYQFTLSRRERLPEANEWGLCVRT